jgi:flagellar protein FliO/FliZ
MGTVATIGRLLLALGFVLGLMWMVGKWAKRGRGGKKTQAMEILARQQLSRNSSVAVVKVLDRAMILGEADLANAQAVLAPAVLAPAVRPARVLPTPRPARAVVRPVSTVAGSPTRAMRGQDSPQPVAKGKLAGSALSIGTWRQAVDAMRERSVRR